jgi:adenylate cyclase
VSQIAIFRRLTAATLPNLAPLIVLVVVSLVLYSSPQKRSLEALNFDLLSIATATGEVHEALVIVGIDDQSFANLDAQWPWPRGVHAHLLSQIKRQNPRSVVFDLLFSEPSDASEDALLAAAIEGDIPVVMASERAVQQTAYAEVITDVLPIKPFLASGVLAGDVGIRNDLDQVVRRLPDRPNSLWRQALKTASSPDAVSMDASSSVRYIQFAGARGTVPTISYYQALFADEFLPEDYFRDKIVLVGFTMLTSPTAKTKGDNHATPFTLVSGAYTPGVEIHANAINTHLQSNIIARIDASWETVGSAIIFFLASAIFVRFGVVRGGGLLLVLAATLMVLSYWVFAVQNIFAPVIVQVSVILGGYFLFTIVRYLREQKQSRAIREAFAHYVPANVVEQLVEDPSQIKLGGDRKKITVMFTDLAGFTSLSEKTGAEELSSILNDHLNRMTKIILKNGGTVDKFIGDAIMAFWGAPIVDPDQAAKAIKCAVEMQQEMQNFRVEYEKMGKPALFMRVGLNTCEAIVGNMGGEDRFDYTAIGDGVNLAARLEGTNKAYGTDILISQNTRDGATGEDNFCLLDQIRVKGKTQPIKIYSVSSQPDAALLCESFMSNYTARCWQDALTQLNAIAEIPELTNYAATMKARIAGLSTTVGDTWDGVTDLEKL